MKLTEEHCTSPPSLSLQNAPLGTTVTQFYHTDLPFASIFFKKRRFFLKKKESRIALRSISDRSAAQDQVSVVQDRRLAGRDGPLGRIKMKDETVFSHLLGDSIRCFG